MKKTILFLFLLICFSCSPKSKIDNSLKNVTKDSTNQMEEEAKIEELPLFDTTIFIKSASKKIDSPKVVSRQMVIDDLYDYFKKKGYYLEYSKTQKADNGKDILVHEIDVPLNRSNDEILLCINSDTTMVHLADLNNDNQLDAIIQYSDFPCYASSHCNQPYKLIAINNGNKFVLQSKYLEFIPTSYSIDSIKTNKEETTIYGYDYFCYDHKTTGYFKAHLKHSN